VSPDTDRATDGAGDRAADRAADALPTLRGRRVTLRPTTRRDILTLAAILSEPAVAHRWPRYDPARVRAELVAGRGNLAWAIEVDPRGLRPSDRDPDAAADLDDARPPIVVGAIQACEENEPDYRHAGIDLFLATAAQGRGLGPEAIRLVATWLVDVRGHHRLTIDPAADNVAAVRAYRKVGFEPVGRLRLYERGADGEWHDAVLMELLAADLVRQG
jgi:aminoglycoside 6'-N-acetyltransferase